MASRRWSVVPPWAFTAVLFVALLGGASLASQSPGMGGIGLVVVVGLIGLWGMAEATVGAIIAWKRPDNRIGRLLQVGGPLVIGVFLGFMISAGRESTKPGDPLGALAGWWASATIYIATIIAFPLIAILFPDGRLPGSRWRWPVGFVVFGEIALSGLHAIAVGPVAPGLADNPVGVIALPSVVEGMLFLGGFLLLVLSLGLAFVAIAVRWRRGDPVERAQLKWLLGALALGAVLFPVAFVDNREANLFDILAPASAMLVPVAIAVAVLRYHLYDIDRIISRTISYGLITATLLAVYGGLILLLQAPLSAVTGGDTVAVAASTLVAAALFQPLRGRIQDAVDRRFNRAHYDAERTAASFAAVLRDEVDPTRAQSALLAAVESAIGPHGVAVWIRGATR